MISASSGNPATSSRIRSSNLTLPNDPNLEPKVAQQTAEAMLHGSAGARIRSHLA
jgi:hypothetical protein